MRHERDRRARESTGPIFGEVDQAEMDQVFNMGIGLALVVLAM